MIQHPERNATVNIPSFDGTPREVAEAWTVRKGARIATCHFWTHPKGGEARLTIGGEWHRGEALRDGAALLDLALTRKAQFQEKGWTNG